MAKSKEVKGSFIIGFVLGGSSWLAGYGAIGTAVILAFTLVGKSIGFHFHRVKLMLGMFLGAALAVVIRWVMKRSIAAAFEEGAGVGNAKKAIEMVWDPVSKSFVMK